MVVAVCVVVVVVEAAREASVFDTPWFLWALHQRVAWWV